jgi:hypothetical protein
MEKNPGKRHGAWYPGISSVKKYVGKNGIFTKAENIFFTVVRDVP